MNLQRSICRNLVAQWGARVVIVVLVVAFLSIERSFGDDESLQLKAPASWQEFVKFRVASDSLGVWVSSGETQAMWEGIPAGIDYSETNSWELANGGNRIESSHHMKSVDGDVITSGAGYSFWDEEHRQVKLMYSGFDTGKPFSGISTLMGIDKKTGTERWSLFETSRGVTTEYVVERWTVDANQRIGKVKAVQREGQSVDGKPWTVAMKRVNKLASVLAKFDITGTWEAEIRDGSKLITRHTQGLDGRAVFGGNEIIKADGSKEEMAGHVMYWDAGRERVAFHGIGKTGGSWHGEMVSLTVDGNKSTMVSRFQGVGDQGESISATVTRVLEGDSMTRTFSDMSFSNMEETPARFDRPTTFQRIKKP